MLRVQQRIKASLLALALLGVILLLTNTASTYAGKVHPRYLNMDVANATQAADVNIPTAPTQPNWLEPRGINIVDLVGEVPEAHLQGAILSYMAGYVQYESGTREGDIVTINTRVTPRFFEVSGGLGTRTACLGMHGFFDQQTTVMPAGTARFFNGDRDVTESAYVVRYNPAGQRQPVAPPRALDRYPVGDDRAARFDDDGALIIPANMGCVLNLQGKFENLRATFVFNAPKLIEIDVLGSESFAFRSYIGVGDAGAIDPLRSQLVRRFGERHDKFELSPPGGTEFVLLNYPPTPVDPYASPRTAENISSGGSGTYRFGRVGDNTLSVDHVNSMLLPLYGQYQDVDQGGGEYLNFFGNANRLAAPEYFVPVGVNYDPCMQSGSCPGSLLDEIFSAEMEMTLYYYSVRRVATGLNQVPLRAVGDGFGRAVASAAPVQQTIPAQRDNPVYLPLIVGPPVDVEPDEPGADCPCGWFTEDGRMVDFVPGGGN